MMFWIALVGIVGFIDIKAAVRHKNYKEIAAFLVLAIGAVLLVLYVQQHPAQISLAQITMQLFHIR